MKKEIKKFWQGKVSLGKSFWLWYVVGGTIIALPGLLIPDSALVTDSAIIIFFIYAILMVAALAFLMIGAFKSAQQYRKIKKKKKQGGGWGIAAQVYIILAAIRAFVEVIRMLAE